MGGSGKEPAKKLTNFSKSPQSVEDIQNDDMVFFVSKNCRKVLWHSFLDHVGASQVICRRRKRAKKKKVKTDRVTDRTGKSGKPTDHKKKCLRKYEFLLFGRQSLQTSIAHTNSPPTFGGSSSLHGGGNRRVICSTINNRATKGGGHGQDDAVVTPNDDDGLMTAKNDEDHAVKANNGEDNAITGHEEDYNGVIITNDNHDGSRSCT